MSTGTSDAKTAVAYVRLAAGPGAVPGGELAENRAVLAQREAIQRAAANVGARLVEEFVDTGHSGMDRHRPGLQRLLAYITVHRVSCCIVANVDRLSRNPADWAAIDLALDEAGVRLISAANHALVYEGAATYA